MTESNFGLRSMAICNILCIAVENKKLQVSFAEYSLFYRALLQKRRIILSSLLVPICNMLCIAITKHCSTLQHTAAHCSTLQHTATRCNTLQHTAYAVYSNEKTHEYSNNKTQYKKKIYIYVDRQLCIVAINCKLH